jgi:hypothetical protein
VNPNVACRSSEPATFKHDEATVQVPTALPPQAVTLVQEAPVPPVPVAPPVPVELLPAVELPMPAVELLVPPVVLPAPPAELPVPADEVPGPPELLELQATTTKTAAVAGRKDRTFIERGLPKRELLSSSYCAVTPAARFHPVST